MAYDALEFLSDDVSAVIKASSLLAVLVDELGKHRARRLDGQAVVDLAVRTLPGIRFADVLAYRDGSLISVAASAAYPPELDGVRSDTGQGPCYEVLNRDAPVVSDDLPEDSRWPAFGSRAFEQSGVRSIASWRVQLPGRETGALSCYSDWPYGFSELAVAAGTILANCCSLTTLTTSCRRGE